MIKKQFFNKFTIIGILVSMLAAFLLFPNNFEMSIFPVAQTENYFWGTLDSSWCLGLNYISLKEINWGKDFAFTLGPLSYLSTRFGWGQSRISFLLFDLFCLINFYIIFFTNYFKSYNKVITTVFILAIALIFPLYLGSLYSFILLSFLLFWIKQSINKNNFWIYLFQTTILVLLFYIKFNTGLISFVLFTTAIAYKLVFKKGKPLLLIGWFLLPIVIIYFTSILLNVSIPEYIHYALQVVSGYNEVMYSTRAFGDKLLFTLILIMIVLGLFVFKIRQQEKKQLPDSLFVLFLFSVSVFVLFKQSFVRSDDSHIREFFYCFLLVLFCSTDFLIEKTNKYQYFFFLLLIAIPFYFVNKLDVDAFPINGKITKNAYVEGFQNFTPTSGFRLFPNNNQLPNNILNRVGNSSIDSYPWNLHILFENKLNYTPRPVFQAYTAYTAELEELNFNHYNSAKAPKFVLYDYGSIDDRYPLFDESKLNYLLKTNYACVDTLKILDRTSLLLEKKSDKPLKFTQTKEYALEMDSPLIPKEGVYYKVYLYNNLLGDFVSIVNHSPTISLGILTKDGITKDYKTSKGLLETGLFGTNHIVNTNDFKNIITHTSSNTNEILAYYFKPESKSLFKSKIRIKEYKVTQ